LTQQKEQKSFASFLQKRRFFFSEEKKQKTFIFYFLAIAITVAPFLAMRVPGLGDTLNHLARMHILTSIDRSADLQRFYVVQWSPVPYLAMDAVVPPLAHFMPLFAAAKVFVAISVLMPFLGAATLHAVVYRRLSLVPAAALLLGASYLVALGFLNYVFMAGLAVMLFAAWIATAAWPRLARIALFTPLATLLYLGHAFAFLGYGCAVAGAEILAAWHTRFRPRPRVLLDFLSAGVQALPALYFAATLDTASGAPGKLYSHYGDPAEKLMALASPLLFLVDKLQVLVLLACVALMLSVAGRLRLPKKVWPATMAVGIAALAAPEILLSTWLTDFRLPLFVMMLLLGGLTLTPAPRWRRPLALALAALLTVKSFDTWRVLRIADEQIAQMRQVLTALPRGSRLLVANESAEPSGPAALSGSTIWTMPLLAVIDRDAFVPYLFTGLTTVHMQPGYAASSTPQGGPVTLQQLKEDLAGQPATLSDVEQREGLRIYWHNWPQKFDYLLVEHFFAMPPANVPKNLASVAQGKDVELFKINHP
jgi:hypothetical protein